jgi:hypothetical protein
LGSRIGANVATQPSQRFGDCIHVRKREKRRRRDRVFPQLRRPR